MDAAGEGYGNGVDSLADQATLSAANQAFYDAFERQSREDLLALWEHSDRVQCTHPGWPILRGWSAVLQSFEAIFNSPAMQFVLTNEHVELVGDLGWITIDENLLTGNAGGTVSAINLFVWNGSEWKMIGHHGSSVVVDLSR